MRTLCGYMSTPQAPWSGPARTGRTPDNRRSARIPLVIKTLASACRAGIHASVFRLGAGSGWSSCSLDALIAEIDAMGEPEW